MSITKENVYFGFVFCHKNLALKQIFSFKNQYFGFQAKVFFEISFILLMRIELHNSRTPCQ